MQCRAQCSLDAGCGGGWGGGGRFAVVGGPLGCAHSRVYQRSWGQQHGLVNVPGGLRAAAGGAQLWLLQSWGRPCCDTAVPRCCCGAAGSRGVWGYMGICGDTWPPRSFLVLLGCMVQGAVQGVLQ